jgi:hypothetical protein
MPLATDYKNILYGKGRLYFTPQGESGRLDLGEIPKFGITVEVEKDPYYSNRSGTRTKKGTLLKEKSAKSSITLDECTAENFNIAFMGDGVVDGSQVAASLDAEETTTVEDRFVDLGKTDLSILKISHGSITSGPFQAGETVTGGTSSATATVAWEDDSDLFLEVIDVSGGPFEIGETITGGTSSASATVSGLETMKDVVVTDAATPTTRYEAGVDYDVDALGGLLRERSGGSIASNTCYVSADCAATTTKSVRGLKGSESRGELLFIGDPGQGPRWNVEVWDVNLVVSGEAEFISEDSYLNIPMEAEFFADETGHPSEPFFRATEIAIS